MLYHHPAYPIHPTHPGSDNCSTLPGTLMGVMALQTPQATTGDEKSDGRWLPKEKTLAG